MHRAAKGPSEMQMALAEIEAEVLQAYRHEKLEEVMPLFARLRYSIARTLHMDKGFVRRMQVQRIVLPEIRNAVREYLLWAQDPEEARGMKVSIQGTKVAFYFKPVRIAAVPGETVQGAAVEGNGDGRPKNQIEGHLFAEAGSLADRFWDATRTKNRRLAEEAHYELMCFCAQTRAHGFLTTLVIDEEVHVINGLLMAFAPDHQTTWDEKKPKASSVSPSGG